MATLTAAQIEANKARLKGETTTPVTPAPISSASTSKVFIPQAQKNKIAAGLSSATDVGITDINKVGAGNLTGVTNRVAATAKPTTLAPETPNKTSGTTVNGVATTSLYQDLKAGKITAAQYQAKLKENMALDTAKQNIQFGVDTFGQEMGATATSSHIEASAKSAAKYKAEAEKKSGPMPTPTPPPEEGWASTEDMLKAQASDAKRLSEWYKKVAQASQEDVGTATAAAADLKDETEQLKASVDAMVANLNASGKGDYASAITSALEEITKSGGGGLNADTLAQITQMAESATDPNEFKAQVTALIKNTPSASMAAAGIVKTDKGFTTKEGLTFSINGLGTPDVSLDGSPIAATGGDLAAMELAVGVKQANIGLEQELALMRDYAKSVARQTVTAKAEIEALKTDAQGRVDESQKAALDELYYSERKLSINKDKSLRNLAEEDAKMEGYMKGQLEAWGANESTAGLAVMGALKIKFLTAFADTEVAYDTELARVSDLEVQARMAYTNRVVEISNQALVATQKVNDTLFDAIDKVETGTSTAYQNKDIKTMDAYRKYFGDLRDMNAAEAKAKADAAKDTRDFNFDLMKEYADQTGYAYEISPDGQSLSVKRDANGNKIPTMAREKMRGSGGKGGTGSTISAADKNWIDSLVAQGFDTAKINELMFGRKEVNKLPGQQMAIWEDYYNEIYSGKGTKISTEGIIQGVGSALGFQIPSEIEVGKRPFMETYPAPKEESLTEGEQARDYSSYISTQKGSDEELISKASSKGFGDNEAVLAAIQNRPDSLR